MIKTYRCKIFPTRKQRFKLKREFGARSWLYHKFITIYQNYYEDQLSYSDMCELLPEIKRENPWLYGIDPQSLQATLRCLEKALKRLTKNAIYNPYYKFMLLPVIYPIKTPMKIDSNYIQVPKIGYIPFQEVKTAIEGIVRMMVVYKIKHKCKYFACILTERDTSAAHGHNAEDPVALELNDRLNRRIVKRIKEKFMCLKEASVSLNPKEREEFGKCYDQASNFLIQAKEMKSFNWQQAACYVLDAEDCLEGAQKLFSNEFHDGLFCNDKFVKRA